MGTHGCMGVSTCGPVCRPVPHGDVGCEDVGLGDVELGEVGLETWDARMWRLKNTGTW